MNDPVEFPEDVPVSDNAKDFIQGLLNRDVSQRLGASPELFERLKAHSWFKCYDWEQLEAKQVDPPFTPDVCAPKEKLISPRGEAQL